MAKLTKKQRSELEGALAALNRAIDYVIADTTAVCRRTSRATTTLDFSRQPIPEGLRTAESERLGHYALTEVNKHIGSNITGLYDAKKRLCQFLELEYGA